MTDKELAEHILKNPKMCPSCDEYAMPDEMVQLAKAVLRSDVSLPWQWGAYAKLGFERDKMDPAHVEIVQKFIGPNPTSNSNRSIP